MFKKLKGYEKYFEIDIDGNVHYFRSGKALNRKNKRIEIKIKGEKSFVINTNRLISLLFEIIPDGFIYIKDYPSYGINKLGQVWNKKHDKILKPYKDKQGYLKVDLFNGNIRTRKSFSVHRLVALHFIPNPENKKEVNHKNGIKSDNRIENLEWVTPKENMQHAYKTGLIDIKKHVKTIRANGLKTRKLTDKQAKQILKSKERRIVLANKYKVSSSTIDRIFQGKTYSKTLKEML